MSGPTENDVIVLCVDGSDRANEAVAAGYELVRAAGRPLVVTVIEARDESLVTGGGHFGGVMSADELDERDRALESDAQSVTERAAAALGIDAPQTRVVRGDAGAALCALASELPARAIVMGSRGHGGMKRAFLGSVSDYVVRNATCPVIITAVKS